MASIYVEVPFPESFISQIDDKDKFLNWITQVVSESLTESFIEYLKNTEDKIMNGSGEGEPIGLLRIENACINQGP